MAKVDPFSLPARTVETKKFECDCGGHVVSLEVRRMTLLDGIGIEDMAAGCVAELEGLVVDDRAFPISQSVGRCIAVVVASQVGDFDDCYSREELAVLMAKSDAVGSLVLDATSWICERIVEGGSVPLAKPGSSGEH